METRFYQVWIDIFEGRAYATRYDDESEVENGQYPEHPCSFRVYADDPETAKKLAWKGFTGKRAFWGVVLSLFRRWLWKEGLVATWLLRRGIFNGPPCTWYRRRFPNPVFYV